MGLFRRKKEKNKKNIDEILSKITEDGISPEELGDAKKVHQYILTNCKRMVTAAKELETQKAEYRELTSYLKDIQIIEELPKKENTVLRETVTNIITMTQTEKDYANRKRKLTDSQYTQMQQDEKIITSAIRNLQENEKYQSTVKRDMQYLESEKTEWIYYRQELASEQKLLRRLSYILFGVLLMLMAIVLVIQVGFAVDTTLIFMFLIFVGGAGGFGIFVRMQNNTKEMKKAEVNMNHAITLLNKVKIKYVHSTNAVDYACEKYHVHNSYELNYLWEQYIETAREMEKYEHNSEDLEFFKGKLVRMLHKLNLYDSKIWLNQLNALIDKAEMEKIKQEMSGQRQRLRTRIEYNVDVVLEQKEEIEDLMKQTKQNMPEVNEILKSVEKLCGVS